jgi:hypothetical protein
LATATAFVPRQVNDLQRERRALNNRVIEMKGNIRVFCRVRPAVHSTEA